MDKISLAYKRAAGVAHRTQSPSPFHLSHSYLIAHDTMSPVLFPPYRAEQIGSLKRPAELLAKRDAFEQGAATKDELKVVEEVAIKNIIAMQREVGIKAITDGEFGR